MKPHMRRGILDEAMRWEYGYTCVLTFAIVIGLSLPALGEVINSSPSQTIRGQIVNVEGPYYSVKDSSGREVKLHIDKDTITMDGTALKAGDVITADVTPKGHATFIIKSGPPSDSGQTHSERADTGGK
ncbi:MAG: hypothetical protein ACREJU_06675 [Nitrospiraceae bacterium]